MLGRYSSESGDADAWQRQLVAQTGIGKSIAFQYWKWISNIVFRLDFWAWEHWEDSTGIVMHRLFNTLWLTGFTIVITWLLGFPIGIYSAVRQHSVGDYVFTFAGFAGLAVPDFLLGLVLLYVFFAFFDMSVGGLFSGDFEDKPWTLSKVMDLLKHLIIPGIVLGTSGTAGLIRIMRNNLLDELSKPYVATARAKGLVEWKMVMKYPTRVAINPFISSLGTLIPTLIGGSVIVSVVLALPTLGPFMLDSLLYNDVRTAASIFLLLGVMSVVGILISDILLAVADPRIKLDR